MIDTSSPSTFLAVVHKGTVLKTVYIEDSRLLSRSLLPSIKTLWQDRFDYIAIGVGPGSYTGTRIGATVAKTLAFGWEIPLIGFSSKMLPNLESIAAFSFEKYQTQLFDSQIELVYFSSTP